MTSLFRALLVLSLVLPGCGGYSKETVGALVREHVGLRVPNQQRLIALATDEAVARLNFKGLAGKKVVVEMSGVFPHTRADVLDYIQSQVEGKIARDGGLVISAGQLIVAPVDAAGSATDPNVGGALSLTPGDADYRVMIGVSWAGVDTHDRKATNTPLLQKQLGLILGGVAAALLAIPIADPTGSPILGGLGLLALSGGTIWYSVQKPVLHIYRLLGRVRLSVNAVPIVPGGTPFQTVGEGQTELLVDPTAEEGYVLQ